MKYSAVIRSLGNTDYLNPVVRSLLDQTIRPEEIVIVVPFGVTLTDFQHTESCRIVESKKGMVMQRNVGMKSAKLDYALLLDDDLLFTSNDSVEKLLKSIIKYDSVCVLPHYPEDNKEGFLYRVFETFFLMAVPSTKNKLEYLRSGGYSYPVDPPVAEPHLTEGGRGACSAINLKWLKENNIFMDEAFERVTYALRDDGAFIYDIALAGGNPIIVNGVSIQHIGITHKATSERLYNLCVATVYNNYIFWYKYIYTKKTMKLLSILAFIHNMVGQIIVCVLKAVKNKKPRSLAGIGAGLKLIVKDILDG
jgi:glycosyltransferase involved in cell wall biosynthesis